MSSPLTATGLGRSLPKLGRLLGWLAVGLALGFLGLKLGQTAPWALTRGRWPAIAATAACGALGYGLAGFLLAEAWRRLLGPGSSEVSARDYHGIYGRSQIAKYLPGNCFHLVGRQLLGRRLGHDHRSLALASVAETILLLLVAGALALPLAWRTGGEAAGGMIAAQPGWMIWTGAAAGLAIAATLVWRRAACGGAGASGAIRRLRALAPRLLHAGLLHALFFIVAGAILWRLAATLAPPLAPAPGLITSVSALALAWAAGFLTPGAAAGLGVREAVLIVALERQLDGDPLVLVAVAMRLVTTCGDAVFFALALALPFTHRSPARRQL